MCHVSCVVCYMCCESCVVCCVFCVVCNVSCIVGYMCLCAKRHIELFGFLFNVIVSATSCFAMLLCAKRRFFNDVIVFDAIFKQSDSVQHVFNVL